MSEDTIANCTDWISVMKRADEQKMVMMLYDNYVGMLKTQAAKEIILFFGMSDKKVGLWS